MSTSSPRKQAFKVGLFVVLVAAILVLALALIGGFRIGRRAHRYFIETEEAVSGIDINSEVSLRGVGIGKVRSIKLDRTSYAAVRIELEIDPDVVIPAGSKAYFERVGLTGERAIDINGGSLAAGRIPPGSEIPRGQTELEMLEARAETLVDDLEGVLGDLGDTVNAVEKRVDAIDPERVGDIVHAVDPERVESIVIETERATKTLAATAVRLRGTVEEARTGIARASKSVDSVARKAETTLGHADDAAQALTDAVANADTVVESNRADLRVTLHNLRRISDDAKALLEALRDNPSLLLRRPKRPRKRR